MNRLTITACLIVALFATATFSACGDDESADNDAWDVDSSQDDDTHGTLSVSTEKLRFEATPTDEFSVESLTVDNSGDDSLHIEGIEISSGTDYFTVADADSVTLEPGESTTVEIEFSPSAEGSATGIAEITSDDPDAEALEVSLAGFGGEPCLEVVTGSEMNFGAVTVGETLTRMISVVNCSPATAVELDDVAIYDDSDGSFSLSDDDPTGTDPGVLDPGETAHFAVEFFSGDEGEAQGHLEIETDIPGRTVDIELIAQGTAQDCVSVEASASVSGESFGDTVDAHNQDIVDLSAGADDADDNTSLEYHWKLLERPPGSTAELIESNPPSQQQLMIDIVGHYLVELSAVDENGVACCGSELLQINAVPDGDVHIQLTWVAPEVEAEGGVNPTQQRGTDLDLHYVRPGGQWGDPLDSVYWQTPFQDWTGDGVKNVNLDIDDLWGAAPENITHSDLEDGAHPVGVHYYRDYDWGPADATVRVYFDDDLVAEEQTQLQETDNFWYVGDVDWGDTPEFVVVDELSDTNPFNSATDIGGQ